MGYAKNGMKYGKGGKKAPKYFLGGMIAKKKKNIIESGGMNMDNMHAVGKNVGRAARGAARLMVPGAGMALGVGNMARKVANKFEDGGKKPAKNPNDKVSYKGKIMKRSQMEAMWAKEDAPKERMSQAEYNKKKSYEDRFDKVNKLGKYKTMENGGKYYKTSDGNKVMKTDKRKKKVEKMRAKASERRERTHLRKDKRGAKAVGTRRVNAGAGDPRTLTQARKTVNVYKGEEKKIERGEKRVQKYIDREGRPTNRKQPHQRGRKKTAPKVKFAKSPGRSKPNYGGQKYKTASFKKNQRCAKRGGRGCRRKQRAAGGSAAFK